MKGSLKLPTQILLLSLLTFLVTVWSLRLGTNVVTHTYEQGTLRFWAGESPYLPPLKGGDQFKYSPLFAMFYYPLTLLSPAAHSLLWGGINIFLFWLGVSLWFRWRRDWHFAMWLALIACSMELNGAILYQQVNALLIGPTLIGLYLFSRRHFFWSGVVLTLCANLKIVPILFALSLLASLNRGYFWGLIVGSLIALGLPSLPFGPFHALTLHLDWAQTLLQDTNSGGILDIATALSQHGWNAVGSSVSLVILYSSLLLLCLMAFLKKESLPWYLWFTLGASCLLLVNPRTEPPTFVFLAPTYLMLTSDLLARAPSRFKRLGVFILCLAIFLVTLSYNDLWPKHLWNPHQTTNFSKTLGALLLWGWGAALSFKTIYPLIRHSLKNAR